MSFPDRFLWGAATSAYQVEGAYAQDGMGESIWGLLAREPDRIFEGHTGDVACDHYHRYAEDVRLMSDIGLQSYRFSIAWPRVLPGGTGSVNEKGLAFYDRLVDELLARGIKPFATLYHWDYPLALHHRGGWHNPDSPHWFAEYCRIVAERLGDRVEHWITFNEPQVFLGMGYQQGRHAPGYRLAFDQVLLAGHRVLLAHGLGASALRAVHSKTQVGFAPVCLPAVPASDNETNVAAAREETFRARAKNCWSNSWWLDPILLGEYPAEGLESFQEFLPPIGANDLEIIAQPLDFLGLNIYQGARVELHDGVLRYSRTPLSQPRNALDWPILPEALRWGPRFCHERYHVPIYITENGVTYRDSTALDGGVHDPNRIDFIARHLLQLRKALSDGADVRGYFYWSFMDNFEWIKGYKERFGLVYVDYETQQRIPKDSALWYRALIECNGANL